MKSSRPHKSLLVWQESIQLVINIYAITDQLPPEEKFGLISQMKRASVSIPANIAEGAARKGNKEFIQFLHIASGSLSELDTLKGIIFRLKYINEKTNTELEEQMDKVSALLQGLINKRNSFNIQTIMGWLIKPIFQ
jgi:four helix bundle protein